MLVVYEADRNGFTLVKEVVGEVRKFLTCQTGRSAAWACKYLMYFTDDISPEGAGYSSHHDSERSPDRSVQWVDARPFAKIIFETIKQPIVDHPTESRIRWHR